MRTFTCSCGSRLFFENSQCLTCQSELAWCPDCNALSAVAPIAGSVNYHCMTCNALLVKCHNYAVEGVCNRAILVGTAPVHSQPLCDYCRFNDIIPDLSVEGNRKLWYRLEKAKRRLLYTLDLMGLPYGNEVDGFEPPLSFDFKGDVENKSKWWWRMGSGERVYTGHANGKITINILEADEIHLVKARVSFEEAHRTEIGHFRHEIGHYYWELLVAGQDEEGFKSVFGDHEDPTYSEALPRYYDSGPPEDWQNSYISSYATMHPWEDFAESFATYLDMVSVLDTAHNMGIGVTVDPLKASFMDMQMNYLKLGVLLNEMNRAQGLIDLVPELLAQPVLDKLEYIHHLLRGARL